MQSSKKVAGKGKEYKKKIKGFNHHIKPKEISTVMKTSSETEANIASNICSSSNLISKSNNTGDHITLENTENNGKRKIESVLLEQNRRNRR